MAYGGNSDPRNKAALASGWKSSVAKVNPADADAIVKAYDAYSNIVNYDANLAIAQAALETGWFASPAWLRYRNAAGLGITGDSVQGPGFGTIERGVQAHLALLNCYYGDGHDPWGVLTEFGMGGMTLGKTTLNGMNGVWAVPGDGYGQHIAEIANSVTGGNVPTPTPDAGVYGEDLIAKARTYIGQVNSDGTLDTLNGAHPWAYWCLAFAESVPRSLGLPQTARNTALDKGNAAQAQGLFRNGPPQHGDWLIFGAAFYSQGHIGFWDAEHNGGMLLGTLTDGTGIGYATYGTHSAGYMGCLQVPGVVAPYRTVPVPVPPPSANIVPPNNPYNHHETDPNKMIGIGGGFKLLWQSAPNPYATFGWPMTNEIAAMVMEHDGTHNRRTVQFYERCVMVYDEKMPPEWQVSLALRTQTVVPL